MELNFDGTEINGWAGQTRGGKAWRQKEVEISRMIERMGGG